MSSRPSFAERARAQARRAGAVCTVSIVLSSMEPGYRAEVEEALADPTIQGTAISRVLAQDSFKVSGLTISRHRRGDCVCGKSE